MRVGLHGLRADIEAAVAEAFRAAGHELGEPAEVVVVGLEQPVSGADLVDLEPATWDAAVVGARSAFFVLQEAARSLAERGEGGCLIVIVPVHSLRTSRGVGPAAVFGSFLTTAAQVAAAELGASDIRVNVLAVGPLESDVPERIADAVPLGRLTRPADIGAASVMLAGSGAAYVSGAVIPLDGGYAVTKAVGGSPFAGA